MKEKGCAFADYNVVLGSNYRYRPCCRFEILDTRELPSAKEYSFKEAFLHEEFASVRGHLNRGEFPKGCEVCKMEEKAGVQSLRERSKSIFERAGSGVIQGLEVFIGSICNMKCVMCGPSESSKWALDLGHAPSDNIDIKGLLDDLPWASIKWIKFMGGEPFLNRKFFEILDLASKQPNASNFKIEIPTNGSVFPSSGIQQKLNRFKSVYLYMSIDAIGQLAELVRPGVEWSKIENSLHKWKELANQDQRYRLKVHTTLHAKNLNGLIDVINFCRSLDVEWGFRKLTFPEKLRIETLSLNERENFNQVLISDPHRLEIKEYLDKRGPKGAWRFITGLSAAQH